MKSGFSVKVAWDTSSIQEWFDSTHPLKIFPIKSELAMKFRKRFVKGFINPGANNIYLGASIGGLLFGVLGFMSPDYGEYDLLMKADTTPSDWNKSTDLLLFALRSNECKKILEQKFNRDINFVYSLAFSLNPSIARYRKHGELISKKKVVKNKLQENEKLKEKARYEVRKAVKNGILIKTACEVCGKSDYVEAHHKNYNEPLNVLWLCSKCHHEYDVKDESCYELSGYNLGYLFKLGQFSLKEAKAQFIQKSWKK